MDCFALVLYVNHVVSRIPDPIRFDGNEVKKVAYFYLPISVMTKPMQVRKDGGPYGENNGKKRGN